MRYYDIQITDPTTNKLVRQYTSYSNGRNDPGALNVNVDIFSAPSATPAQAASVQVWGISLLDLQTDYTNMNVAVYGGFKQPGLPLEDPSGKRSGLITAGFIYQAFGNWQGTDMTLDFVIYGAPGTQASPANIVLTWTAGTQLATAIASTLKTAFPTYKQSISITPLLVLAHDEVGYYQTLSQFAQDIKNISAQAIGGDYPGVDILVQNNTLIVYDGTTRGTPVQLDFADLIGQPTFLNAGQINFTCPMRADLSVNDYVKMPLGLSDVPGAVITTAASQPQARQKSIFQGTFQIAQVHHVGSSRQPDGLSWVTVFDANQAG